MSDAESTALFLTSEDVTGLATPAEYVDAVREGYRERGEGAPPPPNRAVQRRPRRDADELHGHPPGDRRDGRVRLRRRLLTNATPTSRCRCSTPTAVRPWPSSTEPRSTRSRLARPAPSASTPLARRDASDLALFGSGPQARGQPGDGGSPEPGPRRGVLAHEGPPRVLRRRDERRTRRQRRRRRDAGRRYRGRRRRRHGDERERPGVRR